MKSIKRGIIYFNQLNSLDHIQALIVKEGKIIAKEDNKGTQKMLSRFKQNSNGILIKFPKKKQDLRADLPTIGFDTIKECKRIGLMGIVLKNNQHIILDKKKIIEFSNKNKMILHVI